MVTQYPNSGSRKRYACTRLASDYGGPYCQSLELWPKLGDGRLGKAAY
jgi:hypothetical protein